MSTISLNMTLSNIAQQTIADIGISSITLKRFILSSKDNIETLSTIDDDESLIDYNPTGIDGVYTGVFNNTSSELFIGKMLIITFSTDYITEEIFATGIFPYDYEVAGNSSRSIQYQYSLNTEGKPILFNTNATYATRLGSLFSPTNEGDNSLPVYIENGEVKKIDLNVSSGFCSPNVFKISSIIFSNSFNSSKV